MQAISDGQSFTAGDLRGALAPARLYIACEPDGTLAPVGSGDGSSWAAVFTEQLDLGTLMHPGVVGLQTTGDDVLRLIAGHPAGWGIVIDPGNSRQLVIEPGQIPLLSTPAGQEPAETTTAAGDAGIIVGRPSEPLTPATLDTAQRACAAEPAVMAAWAFLWMILERHAEPAIVLGVFLHPDAPWETRTETLNRIHDAINADAVGRDPRVLDVADIDAVDGIFEDLMHTTEPLFKRTGT